MLKPFRIIFISSFIISLVLFFVTVKTYLGKNNNKRYPIINSRNSVLLGGANIAPTSNRSSYKEQIDAWAKHGANFGRLWTVLPWEGADALSPWKRTGPGTANDGGAKFNLDEWDDNYWQTIKEAIYYASQHAITLQYMVFDEHGLEKSVNSYRWFHHPFNPDNNINSLSLPNGDVDGTKTFYDLNNSHLMKYQENYVSKIIKELSGIPNVYLELANETTASWKWQKHFIDYIDNRCDYLIANNPFLHELENLQYPPVDIVNVHNLKPDKTNEWFTVRFKYNKILKYDEQYIGPLSELEIRKIAWFTLTGGGHLNWDESGNKEYAQEAIESINFFLSMVKPNFSQMRPKNDVVREGIATVLANEGKEYIVYTIEKDNIELRVPNGEYTVLFYNPATQKTFRQLRLATNNSVNFSKPTELNKPVGFSLNKQTNIDWCLYIESLS